MGKTTKIKGQSQKRQDLDNQRSFFNLELNFC